MSYQSNIHKNGDMKWSCEESTREYEESDTQEVTPKLKKISELFPTLEYPQIFGNYGGNQSGMYGVSIQPHNVYEALPAQICYGTHHNYYNGLEHVNMSLYYNGPEYNNMSLYGMYGNSFKMSSATVPKNGFTLQKLCCVEGCEEAPHQRSRKSIKVDYAMKKGFRKNRMDKICNRCYYRFRYQYKKMEKEAKGQDKEVKVQEKAGKPKKK